jgi:hypothetical protein
MCCRRLAVKKDVAAVADVDLIKSEMIGRVDGE